MRHCVVWGPIDSFHDGDCFATLAMTLCLAKLAMPLCLAKLAMTLCLAITRCHCEARRAEAIDGINANQGKRRRQSKCFDQ